MHSKKIRFEKLKKSLGEVVVSFCDSLEDKTNEIEFSFEKNGRVVEFIPSNDAISYALSPLCWKKYDEIFFDWPITKNACDNIEKYTGALVHANSILDASNADSENLTKTEKIILSFSGGWIA